MAWLLIIWISGTGSFSIAVDAESSTQCEAIYQQLSERFVRAEHVCLKRPATFSQIAHNPLHHSHK